MFKHLQLCQQLQCDGYFRVKLVLDDVLNECPVTSFQSGVTEVRDHRELCVCVCCTRFSNIIQRGSIHLRAIIECLNDNNVFIPSPLSIMSLYLLLYQ